MMLIVDLTITIAVIIIVIITVIFITKIVVVAVDCSILSLISMITPCMSACVVSAFALASLLPNYVQNRN